jgi:hypothetical protein
MPANKGAEEVGLRTERHMRKEEERRNKNIKK